MDTNTTLMVLLSVAGFAVTWWVKVIWAGQQSLQQQVTALNLKIAENYMPKSDVEKTMERIFLTMEEIKRDVTHMSKNYEHIKALNSIKKGDVT